MVIDKKDFLSDGLFRCNTDTIDVINIEQKIKKIHKKKYKENFKKIEELSNIYNSPQKEGFSLDFLNMGSKCNKKVKGEK